VLDDFVRDLRLLQQADSLLGRLWLKLMARRLGFYALASLIGALGLGMANLAGYLALEAIMGPVWAAAALAIVDFIIAAAIFLAAMNSDFGSDIDQAFDARQTAIRAVETDGLELKATIDGLRQEVRDIRDTVAAFAHNPLDAAAQKLLIPAAISLVNGLRSNKREDAKAKVDSSTP
jgi:hypothetical protein